MKLSIEQEFLATNLLKEVMGLTNYLPLDYVIRGYSWSQFHSLKQTHYSLHLEYADGTNLKLTLEKPSRE
jgi:hypothetical protein